MHGAQCISDSQVLQLPRVLFRLDNCVCTISYEMIIVLFFTNYNYESYDMIL